MDSTSMNRLTLACVLAGQLPPHLSPGVLLPARIFMILMEEPLMQLSAADTLRICPP